MSNELWTPVINEIYAKVFVEGIGTLSGLLGRFRIRPKDFRKLAEGVLVFPNHREKLRDRLYGAAFASAGDVLYLSIMSKHSLIGIESNLEQAEKWSTTLSVLTWNPQVGVGAIRAFGRHIAEETTAEQQVKEAHTQWSNLVASFPRAIKEVRCYSSSPTMQGILVRDDWALVELMPYRVPPNRRPAMYLTATGNPEVFPVFQQSFDELWRSGKRVVPTPATKT